MSNTSRSEIPKADTPDTVPVSRDTSQRGYQAVLSDFQRVLTVPFDLLRKRIVQDNSLDKGRIAQIRADLEKRKFIVSNEQGTHWKEFETSPASSKSESKTFAFLTPIINFILRQQSSCVVDYFDNPNSTPFSSRNNTSRPDGYIRLLNTTTVESIETNGSTRHHWFDIAVLFEFKLKNGPNDTLDDERKIIWSLHNILREDPCRRFVYGITIEDANMNLWLANRACVVVTKSINFLRGIDDFISLFSALGAATDVALGWDPTIERIIDTENKNPTQYRIKVNETVYTTTDEIATFGADSLVGRGTRVYRAKDAQGNVVAIKDFWKDIDLLAEGKIIAEILKAIRDKFPTEAEEATKYFVSVKDFGNVIVNGSEDCTVAFTDNTEGGALPKDCRWREVDVSVPLLTNSHIPSTGNILDSENLSQVSRHARHQSLDSPIPRKVHHRTVFHDVGTALQDMLTLKDIIACLRDTLQGNPVPFRHVFRGSQNLALYYMHRVGWIHRDYSVGNALQVVKDGRGIGKLSDFEYAKLITSNTCHDVRTGTLDFMAWEVDQQLYMFMPESVFPESYRVHDMENTSSIASPPPPIPDEPPTRPRIGVLDIYMDPTGELKAQRDARDNLFPDHLAHAPRFHFLTHPPAFQPVFDSLSRSCKRTMGPVFTFAKDLVTAYRKAEAPYPNIHIPDEDIEDIHNKVRGHLHAAWQDSEEVDLVRIHTLDGQSRKRPIAEADTSPTKNPAPKKQR